MTLVKPGDHLRSRACTAEVIVVKAPSIDVTIACGGEPMSPKEQVPVAAASDVAAGPGTLLGKRYADEEVGIELLCVKGGSGQISVDGRPLAPKEARPLPASD
jgi:hypothetical protein